MMANIRGFHVSMHCSMASEVMESFLSVFVLFCFVFFSPLSIKYAFELPDLGTEAASEVNGAS